MFQSRLCFWKGNFVSIITCKSNIKWILIQTDWNEIKENDIAILCDAIQNRAHKLILAAASHFIKY